MDNIRNIKIIIEYDGSNYSGWQIQNNSVTIQGVLKNALERLTGEKIDLVGASRTDAGVHAYGQVANFLTSTSIPSEKICFAINNMLPNDIVVKSSLEVSKDFHSRFCSKGKIYRYFVYNQRTPSAIFFNRAFHYPFSLNIEKMIKASKYFLGTHDFTSFRAAKCGAKTSIRTINALEIKLEGERVVFEISGDGFLYNMVRIIVGTLLDVGSSKLEVDEIPNIIEGKNRLLAGKTVPACGLYLCRVNY